MAKLRQSKATKIKKRMQITKRKQPENSPSSFRQEKASSQTHIKDPCMNARMQEVIDSWKANPESYSNIREAASKNGFNYKTFYNRLTGRAQTAQEAHTHEQAIPPVAEQVLADWTVFLGLTGHAQSKANIVWKAEELTSRKLGKHWLARFLKRHPEIRLARPTGLDPKQVQAFNYTTMSDHFNKLGVLINMYSLGWHNIYNMDEKGIQAGGGRNSLRKKLLFSRTQRIRQKLTSSDLELVTVAECVSADGYSMPPGFVFSGTQIYEDWCTVDPDIL
jgi:hypothetical protein